MSECVRNFKLDEIPDPKCAAFRAVAGDPKRAIWDATAQLVRYMASLTPDSCALSLMYVFDPSDGGMADPQRRLAVYATLHGANPDCCIGIESLLTKGHLAHFTRWQPVAGIAAPWQRLFAGMEILRRASLVAPLTPREQNALVPDAYYLCAPFEPNVTNDFLAMDRVLDSVEEPVVVTISIRPTDITRERGRHAEYLSRVQRINRPWSTHPENADYSVGMPEPYPDGRRSIAVTPLHHPDPIAEDVLRGQQELHRILQEAHLAFRIVTLAETPAVATLIAATLADNAFSNGSYDMKAVSDAKQMAHLLRCVRHGAMTVDAEHDPEAPGYDGYGCFRRLPYTASVKELEGAFRIPVAVSGTPVCIRKNTDPPDLAEAGSLLLGYDDRSTVRHKAGRGIRLCNLVKHVLAAGAPGCGKTTLDMGILLALHQAGVPVLIFDCAKKEYRALKKFKGHADRTVRRFAELLEIYTPGREDLSPFRFNLMQVFPGSSVTEHSDALLRIFEAVLPQAGPVASVLGQGIDLAFESLRGTRNPEMDDLLAAALSAIRRKAYSSDTRSDLTGAIETRCGILTRGTIGSVFCAGECIPPVEHVFESSTVLELDALAPYPASVLVLCQLQSLRSFLRTLPPPARLPRFVIVISEAHRLLRRSGEAAASADSPDPRAYVVELVCEMLAELRALGVGTIISDQQPSKLAPEIVSLTETKIAFRLVEKADRDVMAASMLFGQREYDDLARLGPGEAYLFAGGFHEPCRIKTVNLHERFDLSPPTDAELMEIIRGNVV
jgi:hypothetical protein